VSGPEWLSRSSFAGALGARSGGYPRQDTTSISGVGFLSTQVWRPGFLIGWSAAEFCAYRPLGGRHFLLWRRTSRPVRSSTSAPSLCITGRARGAEQIIELRSRGYFFRDLARLTQFHHFGAYRAASGSDSSTRSAMSLERGDCDGLLDTLPTHRGGRQWRRRLLEADGSRL